MQRQLVKRQLTAQGLRQAQEPQTSRLIMTGHHIENDTIVGTVGGTILSIIPHLDSADLIRTLILATVGAVVSFLATQIMKWLKMRIKK